jgi:hypothetical protein
LLPKNPPYGGFFVKEIKAKHAPEKFLKLQRNFSGACFAF